MDGKMKALAEAVSSAERDLTCLLWPPLGRRVIYDEVLGLLLNRFGEEHRLSLNLVLGLVDDDQLVHLAKSIWEMVKTEKQTSILKGKVEDGKLSIFLAGEPPPAQSFIPINVVSVDGGKVFLLFREDLSGDLSCILAVEEPKIREYVEVTAGEGRRLFDSRGFNEEEVMRLLSGLIRGENPRKETLTIKYVGNTDQQLGGGGDYKSLLPRELASIISSVEDFLRRVEATFHTRFINYARHDTHHLFSVARRLHGGLLRLEGENLFFRLNAVERFLLLGSSLLHDIGMALPDEVIAELDLSPWRDTVEVGGARLIREMERRNLRDRRELVRKLHAFLGGSFVSDMLSAYVRNEHLEGMADVTGLLGALVASHSLKFNLESLEKSIPYTFRDKEYRVRMRMLASLLRVGDSTDISMARADPLMAHLINLWREEPIQVKHWAFKLLVKEVTLEQTEGGLVEARILHHSADREEAHGLAIFEGVNLLVDLASVAETLREAGLEGDAETDIKIDMEPAVRLENLRTRRVEILRADRLEELLKEQTESEEFLFETACQILSRYRGIRLTGEEGRTRTKRKSKGK